MAALLKACHPASETAWRRMESHVVNHGYAQINGHEIYLQLCSQRQSRNIKVGFHLYSKDMNLKLIFYFSIYCDIELATLKCHLAQVSKVRSLNCNGYSRDSRIFFHLFYSYSSETRNYFWVY